MNQNHWVVFGVLLFLQLRFISTQSGNIPGEASGTSFTEVTLGRQIRKEPRRKVDQKLNLQYPQIKGKILTVETDNTK
jgi:hypothetical protein